MNEEKAKFILSAYRPGHEDRDDPEFSEALEMARLLPELGEWLEKQIDFDRRAAAAFGEIPVPGDLRGKILAGGSISALPSRAGWRNWVSSPGIRAIAALVVVGLFLAVAVIPRGGRVEDDWRATALATLSDLYDKKANLDLKTGDVGAIRAWLEDLEPSLVESIPIQAAISGAIGCKQVKSADGLVTIVCFKHDGKMFHLASYRLPEGDGGGLPADPSVAREGQWLAATWERGDYVHMLVTGDESVGPEAMRRVIEEFNA